MSNDDSYNQLLTEPKQSVKLTMVQAHARRVHADIFRTGFGRVTPPVLPRWANGSLCSTTLGPHSLVMTTGAAVCASTSHSSGKTWLQVHPCPAAGLLLRETLGLAPHQRPRQHPLEHQLHHPPHPPPQRPRQPRRRRPKRHPPPAAPTGGSRKQLQARALLPRRGGGALGCGRWLGWAWLLRSFMPVSRNAKKRERRRMVR